MEHGQSQALCRKRRVYRFAHWSIAIAAIITLTVSHRRQQEQLTVARTRPESHAKGDSASETLTQLSEIDAALQRQPASTLLLLPSYARSFDSSVAAAEKAKAASDAGSLTEAVAQRQNAAETLSEFARLAKGVPQLASLADRADGLAKQFDLLSISSGGTTTGTHAPATNPQ